MKYILLVIMLTWAQSVIPEFIEGDLGKVDTLIFPKDEWPRKPVFEVFEWTDHWEVYISTGDQ